MVTAFHANSLHNHRKLNFNARTEITIMCSYPYEVGNCCKELMACNICQDLASLIYSIYMYVYTNIFNKYSIFMYVYTNIFNKNWCT